jgi:hypothetical protein
MKRGANLHSSWRTLWCSQRNEKARNWHHGRKWPDVSRRRSKKRTHHLNGRRTKVENHIKSQPIKSYPLHVKTVIFRSIIEIKPLIFQTTDNSFRKYDCALKITATFRMSKVTDWMVTASLNHRVYRWDNRRFWLSAHNCQVPTPTSQNLELEQQIRIFPAD